MLAKEIIEATSFFRVVFFINYSGGKPPMSETRDRTQRLNKSRFKDIVPLTEIAPELPFPLVRVVNKSLEFNPDKRYQMPGEMLADLKLAIKRVKEQGEGQTMTPAESGPMEGHDASGEPRRLMIVESDTKMQDLLRELFKKRGYRVLVTSDPERLFQRFYENSKTADVLLMSSGHLGRERGQSIQSTGRRIGDQNGASSIVARRSAGSLARIGQHGRASRSDSNAREESPAAAIHSQCTGRSTLRIRSFDRTPLYETLLQHIFRLANVTMLHANGRSDSARWLV